MSLLCILDDLGASLCLQVGDCFLLGHFFCAYFVLHRWLVLQFVSNLDSDDRRFSSVVEFMSACYILGKSVRVPRLLE